MAEKQSRIPGMPGPPDEIIKKQENLIKAFRVMHTALLDVFEALPEGSQVSIGRKVKGDLIKVAFKAGAHDEAEEPTPPRITLGNIGGEKTQ